MSVDDTEDGAGSHDGSQEDLHDGEQYLPIWRRTAVVGGSADIGESALAYILSQIRFIFVGKQQ